MLQTRNGKRTAMAALKFSMDMFKEKLIDWKTAVMRNPADQLDQLLAPVFDVAEAAKAEAIATGLPAGPGAASGQIYLNADRAVGRGGTEGAGPARPRRDVAGRSPRHDRRRRHSDGARRRVVARRAGRAADGQGLRLRRGGARSRLPGAHRQGRRQDLSRKATGCRSTARPGRCSPAASTTAPSEIVAGLIDGDEAARQHREVQELPAADEVVRRRDADVGAHQRRHARSRRRTRSRSAPSASASAGPSTCSSRATASTRCAR